MDQITAEEIRNFYETITPKPSEEDGAIYINPMKTRSLVERGLDITKLSYESLTAALIGSLNSSLYRGMGHIGNEDLNHLWSWCAQMIWCSTAPEIEHHSSDIKSHLEHVVTAANASLCRFDRRALPHFAGHLISCSSQIFPYLTFPLLECLLRKVNNQFVDESGLVLNDFTASQSYKATGKKRCNSIRDLLMLYYNSSSADKKKTIDDCMKCVAAQNNIDPFEQIYDWRNGLLHGEEIINTAGCSILTLCCIILLQHTEDDFEEMKATGQMVIQRFSNLPYRPRHSLYPPY